LEAGKELNKAEEKFSLDHGRPWTEKYYQEKQL
jgi:hypothetical protein